MVYDEGFSLDFEDFSFFTFFKYSIETEKNNISLKSFCHSTLTGWYNNKDKSEWGCFKAFKKNINLNLPTFIKIKNNFQNDHSIQNKISNYHKLSLPTDNETFINNSLQNYAFGVPTSQSFNQEFINFQNFPFNKYNNINNDFILQPVPITVGLHRNQINNVLQSNGNIRGYLKPGINIAQKFYNFKQIFKESKNHNIDEGKNKYSNNNEINLFVDNRSNLQKNKNKMKNNLKYYSSILPKKENKNYLDIEKLKNLAMQNDTALIEILNIYNNDFDSKKYILLSNIKKIEELNKIDKSWEAGIYKDFAINVGKQNLVNKSNLKYMNFRFKNKEKTIESKLNTNFEKLNKQELLIQDLEFQNHIKLFPKEFDWMNLLRPAAKQGNCGSCYAISTLRMAESRLKLFYNHIVELSVQHVLDCSYYNQGCDGGYAFLVMKFANEFELIPESCKPYTVKIFKY